VISNVINALYPVQRLQARKTTKPAIAAGFVIWLEYSGIDVLVNEPAGYNPCLTAPANMRDATTNDHASLCLRLSAE